MRSYSFRLTHHGIPFIGCGLWRRNIVEGWGWGGYLSTYSPLNLRFLGGPGNCSPSLTPTGIPSLAQHECL